MLFWEKLAVSNAPLIDKPLDQSRLPSRFAQGRDLFAEPDSEDEALGLVELEDNRNAGIRAPELNPVDHSLGGLGSLSTAKQDFSGRQHGDLPDLNLDQHFQYHTDVRGDVRYYTQTQLKPFFGGLGILDEEFENGWSRGYKASNRFTNFSVGGGHAGSPITLNSYGRIDPTMLGGGSGYASDSFTTIDCPQGTDPVADGLADTLQFLEGSNLISITGDSSADSVTLDVVQANIDHGSIAGLANDDHTIYFKADGTRALTGDVDVGAATRDFKNGSDVVLRLLDVASAANFLEISNETTPNGTTGGPLLRTGGSGTHVDLRISAKGSGWVRFLTNGMLEGTNKLIFRDINHHISSRTSGQLDIDATTFVNLRRLGVIKASIDAIGFTVGSREAGVDYRLKFLGETNDGTLTWMEDEARFDFDSKIKTDVNFESAVVTGTAPLVVASTTVCANLNADLLDGSHASAFAGSSHTHAAADVTSGEFPTARIANEAITYAKIQDVSATDRLLGRVTAGAGVVEEITLTGAGRALLDDADAAAQRTTLGLGSIAVEAETNYLLAAGSRTLSSEWNAGPHTIGFDIQTATGDGTTTIDWRLGNKFNFTFGAQDDTFTFTAPSKPCNLMLKLIQDGTGGRSATWPATVKWAGGTSPTLTAAGGSVDVIAFYFDGTNYHGTASLDSK